MTQPRLPDLDLSTFSEKQAEVYKTIKNGQRACRWPRTHLDAKSELAEHAQALGQYARFDSCLPPRLLD